MFRVFWFQECFCSSSFSKSILKFQILEIADPLLKIISISDFVFRKSVFHFWFQKIVYFVFGFRFVRKSDVENGKSILVFWFRKSLYFVFGFGFRKSNFRFWFQKILDFVFRKSCLVFWFHIFLYTLFLQVDSEFSKRFSHRSFSNFV